MSCCFISIFPCSTSGKEFISSLLQLEQTCQLLRQVVSHSGEYARRCRALGLTSQNNGLHCKLQLIQHNKKTLSAFIIS